MLVFINDSRNSTGELLRLINAFNKVARFKINYRPSRGLIRKIYKELK